MSNVIEFTSKEEDFKNVSYVEDKDDLGVSTRCRSLSIYRLNKDEFEAVHGDESFILTREVLAEFIHVAQVFVDDESKYRPELEMISCDY